MKLKMLLVMDPIQAINTEKDTTFVLMLESQSRGHLVYYLEAKDLFVKGGKAWGKVVNIRLQMGEDYYRLLDSDTVPLESFDAVWMRKDPPFNMDYVYTTYILSLINPEETLVVNNPQGIRESNEKLYSLYFPDLVPESTVTKDKSRLKTFLKEVGGEMVVKPLHSYGGEGVFYVKEGDKNANVIIETITKGGSRYVLAQKFIEKVLEGDKRIILLNGEPLGAVLRIAGAGDFRCNFHSGGSPAATRLDERDLEICRGLAPKLKEDGLYFVGIDVIGGYLTEVNTTSPTGVQEINRLNGTKLETQVIDFVEERCKR